MVQEDGFLYLTFAIITKHNSVLNLIIIYNIERVSNADVCFKTTLDADDMFHPGLIKIVTHASLHDVCIFPISYYLLIIMIIFNISCE